MAIDPEIPNGYLNLGNSYAMLNNLKDAANSYKKQIANQPESVLALTNLGRLYQVMGDELLGKKYLKKAIKVDP